MKANVMKMLEAAAENNIKLTYYSEKYDETMSFSIEISGDGQDEVVTFSYKKDCFSETKTAGSLKSTLKEFKTASAMFDYIIFRMYN